MPTPVPWLALTQTMLNLEATNASGDESHRGPAHTHCCSAAGHFRRKVGRQCSIGPIPVYCPAKLRRPIVAANRPEERTMQLRNQNQRRDGPGRRAVKEGHQRYLLLGACSNDGSRRHGTGGAPSGTGGAGTGSGGHAAGTGGATTGTGGIGTGGVPGTGGAAGHVGADRWHFWHRRIHGRRTRSRRHGRGDRRRHGHRWRHWRRRERRERSGRGFWRQQRIHGRQRWCRSGRLVLRRR